jgi:hypothetical protein
MQRGHGGKVTFGGRAHRANVGTSNCATMDPEEDELSSSSGQTSGGSEDDE